MAKLFCTLQCLFMILTIITTACQASFHFTDCGHGEVKSLQLSGCTSNSAACVIFKGESVHLAGDFIANQNASNVEIQIRAKLAGSGIEMVVPGVESDGCNHLTCPLVSGRTYHFGYDLVLPRFLPTTKSSVTAKLINSSEGGNKEKAVILCINFDVDVRDRERELRFNW